MKAETATMTTDRGSNPEQDSTSDSQEWYESDLQLAAELGKTLLERNQELEENLRQHQIIIEEQANEIEYLTRQASALREVNDSRLKVYEQLEVSITELERANQKLQQENTTDKKRIKSLYNNIDTLEKKCEELQELVDDMRSAESQKQCKQYQRQNSSPPEIRKVINLDSCGLIESSFVGNEINPVDKEVSKLKTTISKLKCQVEKERERREELELEISNLLQENSTLQQQIQELRSNQKKLTLQEEFIESESLCQHCTHQPIPAEEDCIPPVLVNEAEPEEPLQTGECTVVQLHNGGLAYGSHTSLQTAGLPVMQENSDADSDNNRNSVSLFSELDDQYKRLIQKYEKLLGNHENGVSEDEDDDSSSKSENRDDEENNIAVTQEVDSHHEMPSPSLLSDHAEHSKACLDDGSEAIDSSLSSGFSDMSDHMTVDKEVQTDPTQDEEAASASNCKVLSLSSATNSLEGHFNHSPPEYKKLFQEIFAVLKRSLHSDESDRLGAKKTLADFQDSSSSNPETSSEQESTLRSSCFKHSCEASQRWSHHSSQQQLDKAGSTYGSLEWARASAAKGSAATRIHPPGSMTYAEVLVKGQKRPLKVSSRCKFPVKQK